LTQALIIAPFYSDVIINREAGFAYGKSRQAEWKEIVADRKWQIKMIV
jgi:hypothetical protein